MPQIAQLAATYSSQIFWLLITFGFVFFVVGLGMVPKVQSVVDLRDKKIADDLAEAKAAFAASDALEEQHRKQDADSRAAAQQLVANAKTQAALETEVSIKAADADFAALIAAAEDRIGAARSAALSQMADVAADAASDMANRVAGLSVTPDAAKAAVKAVMSHG